MSPEPTSPSLHLQLVDQFSEGSAVGSEGNICFVEFANFSGVNAFARGDYKLLMWHHSMQSWTVSPGAAHLALACHHHKISHSLPAQPGNTWKNKWGALDSCYAPLPGWNLSSGHWTVIFSTPLKQVRLHFIWWCEAVTSDKYLIDLNSIIFCQREMRRGNSNSVSNSVFLLHDSDHERMLGFSVPSIPLHAHHHVWAFCLSDCDANVDYYLFLTLHGP